MTETQTNAVLSRLDALSQQVSYLVEQQRKQQELIDELVLPIAKEVMQHATGKLSELEKAGYFAFAKELMNVGQRIVESYSADDVRRLGDAVTSILDTVRAMTQPEVLAIANGASEVLSHAGQTKPIGLMGMVRATRNQDVGRGMAVMFEVLRQVGHGAAALSNKQASGGTKRDRVNALLAPRLPSGNGRARRSGNGANGANGKAVQKPLGYERPSAEQAAKPVAAKAQPPAGATAIGGVAFTADGHLEDSSQWTRELAQTLAEAQGVVMTEAHWKIIEFARKDHAETKASPNIRRITLQTGMATKDLYALFPRAPARTIAKIAGLPKPTGCL